MKRKPWTDDEVSMLKELYPRIPSVEVAARMKRTLTSISTKAFSLGLLKTEECRRRLNKDHQISVGLPSCVIFKGRLNADGYGVLQVGGRGGRKIGAHKYEYEKAHGPIPDGMVVMHSCDNPACINIKHLSLGTPADNAADRNQKNRQARQFGETNGRAKLDEAAVRQIRSEWAAGKWKSKAACGRHYGVHSATIKKILIGKLWPTT